MGIETLDMEHTGEEKCTRLKRNLVGIVVHD